MMQKSVPNAGAGSEGTRGTLEVNLSVNAQPTPLSGQRITSGNTTAAPNSALPPMQKGDNGGQDQITSFDKRPPQHPQMIGNGINGEAGQMPLDIPNKENMSQKHVSRKGTSFVPGSINSAEATTFSTSQKARILQLSNSGYDQSQTMAKNSQRSDMVIK